MVAYTTTYNLKKPTVADDEDVWGGYLNDSMDLIDDVLDGTTPVTGIDINSGTIDNTVIGGTTPVAGTFTALTANTSLAVTGNITVSGTVDGRDVAADGTKLDGIESGATADQTKADIDALGIAASTAATLATARNIALTGAVTGNVNFDGSGNVSIATTATSDPTLTLSGDASGSATFTNLGNATLNVTVADDSHNHVISNVDGLQTALDGKLSTSGKAADSQLLDGVDGGSFLRSDVNDTTTGRLSVDNELLIVNGNGTNTHWNYQDGNTNYIRGTNTTFDTPIDMNGYAISDTGHISVGDHTKILKDDDLKFIAPSSTTGVQAQRIAWWNENEAGIMAMIAVDRTASSLAPADMVFYTTNNVDTTANSSEGNRAERLRVSYDGVYASDTSFREDYDALSGTSPTCNVTSGGAFSLTMSGNTTFTFTSPDSGWSTGFILQLTGNGSTVTWPSSVDWAGGTAPDAPASGETDIYVFWTRDGGTTWYGVQSIDAAA